MMKYEKPIIQINSEMAEGVYAASGEGINAKALGCDSTYTGGVYRATKYGVTLTGNETMLDTLGCLGCLANRGNACGLVADYIASGCPSSYEIDAKIHMPAWEASGKTGASIVESYDDWGKYGNPPSE